MSRTACSQAADLTLHQSLHRALAHGLAGAALAALASAVAPSSPAAGQVARPLPNPVPPVARPLPTPPTTRPAPLPAPEPPTTRPAPIPAPMPPSTLPAPLPPSGSLFAGSVKCESDRNRSRTCGARNNQGRVEIVQVHGGSCVRNRSFYYSTDSITVTDGCRATFAYGYGNHRPKASSGPNALPWLLAGAGATAGIVAIINSGNDRSEPEARPAPPPPPPAETPPQAGPQPPFPALPPAAIEANTQFLTADQQRSMQTCLLEGARQTGITGGTVLRLDAMESIEQGNGGWRFRFRATTTHPDRQRQFSVFCRATPTSIVEFTVTPVALAEARP
jgi:hypothetical protein